jgi:hypothetical protein
VCGRQRVCKPHKNQQILILITGTPKLEKFTFSVHSHQKMQNRQIAQNATLSKIFTAHIALVRMFAGTHAGERHLHSDWLVAIYSQNATSSFA